MSLEYPTLVEVERLRKQMEALASEEYRVKVLPSADLDGAVSAPRDMDDAVRQLNLLRDRISEAATVISSDRERIRKLEVEVARCRRGWQALRDVLGTFSEASPGWHRSALVCDDDMRGWQADAGL